MEPLGRQALAQRLRDEARESWDYFISDQVVYVAQLKGAKSPAAPYRWVRDYVEGSFWFEVILYSRPRKNPLAVWLIESGTQNLGLRGAHAKAHQAFDGDDQSVFIDAREFIEDSEQFEFRPLRSVVWLKRLDGIDCGGKNALADPELSRDVPEGKRDAAFVVGGDESLGYLRLPLGKSPSDVIQGRSQVGHDIPDHEAPRRGVAGLDRYLIHDRTGNGMLTPPCQCALSDDGDIWIGRVRDTLDEFFDVHFRPLDLGAGAAQWVLRGVNYGHGQEAETEDSKGLRDSGPQAVGFRERSGCCGEAEEVTASPHEEVASRTSPDRRSGCCSATRTRSGSPEDA